MRLRRWVVQGILAGTRENHPQYVDKGLPQQDVGSCHDCYSLVGLVTAVRTHAFCSPNLGVRRRPPEPGAAWCIGSPCVQLISSGYSKRWHPLVSTGLLTLVVRSAGSSAPRAAQAIALPDDRLINHTRLSWKRSRDAAVSSEMCKIKKELR